MILSSLASKLFGNLVDMIAPQLEFLTDYLIKADIRVPTKVYVSCLILYGVIANIIFIPFLYWLSTMFSWSPLINIAAFIFLPVILFLMVFLIGIFYPIEKTIRRKRDIETNLPFVLTHMGAIAQSGVPPQHLFKIISKFKEYGEISREFEKIVRNIEVFGQDPLTAIREVSQRTPSDRFKEVLIGFVSTIEAGGNIKQYLKVLSEQTLFEWRTKRQKFINQLATYAEFYTGILIAAPLIIVALFGVLAMFQPTLAGFDIVTLTKLSTYVLVPVINIGFLLFLSVIEVEI